MRSTYVRLLKCLRCRPVVALRVHLNEKDIFMPRKCFKTDFTICFFIFVLVTAWRKEIHAHRGDLLQSTFLNLIW